MGLLTHFTPSTASGIWKLLSTSKPLLSTHSGTLSENPNNFLKCFSSFPIRQPRINIRRFRKPNQVTMDNFHISIATIDHREEIREFLMKHFLVEETMNVATSITEEEFGPFADATLDSSLLTPFSVICRGENGKIAGVALSTVCHRDDPEFSNPLGSPQRPEIAAIAAICEDIHGSLWRLLDPDIKSVLELDILSVALQHQRRGIAGKMLEKRKSLELLKEFKIQGFVCQASSYANQMLLRKRGYQELKDIPFARFADQNGTQLIKPHDQTRSVKLFWKPYNP
ncbi:hypothetical protein RB195_001539 [Necator americanus]|uniref:N-acetyltransferase domain-containing protein n=1 Tax=Necator americanus TaxID=51031 RepID=A0ABR1DF06_NECAM